MHSPPSTHPSLRLPWQGPTTSCRSWSSCRQGATCCGTSREVRRCTCCLPRHLRRMSPQPGAWRAAPQTTTMWPTSPCGGRCAMTRGSPLHLADPPLSSAQAALSNVPQIPFTHPPLGQPVSASRRNVRQQRLADGKPAPPPAPKAVVAPRMAGVVYCHAFAEGRPCARSAAGQRCPYPHLSLEQVNAVAERRTDGSSLTAEMKAYLRTAKKRKGHN